jgi:uncharacterized protein (TIGR02145 family)
VNDPRGLAPVGYHIPTDVEWTVLTNYLGGELVAGGEMKETGFCHWSSPNTDATNSSGFTGLAGGIRLLNGSFNLINNEGYWWSSSDNGATVAWRRNLNYNTGNVARGFNNNNYGFSVRLIKD